MFRYLCYTWKTDSFTELILSWFNFYGQWLTHPFLCLFGQWLTQCHYIFSLDSGTCAEYVHFLRLVLFPGIFDGLYFKMERITLVHISFVCLIVFYIAFFNFPSLGFAFKFLFWNDQTQPGTTQPKKSARGSVLRLLSIFEWFFDIYMSHHWRTMDSQCFDIYTTLG